MFRTKRETRVIDRSGDPRLLLSLVSTMAKTDPEADVSEHTSENEDVEEVQSEGGGPKMTLEQRQQKLAQLRSRMVCSDTASVKLGLAYE